MNAKQHFEKAIREGIKYTDENGFSRRAVYENQEVDRMASTLSAGLIVLTEAMMERLITESFEAGASYGQEWPSPEFYTRVKREYASRIMREVKGGE